MSALQVFSGHCCLCDVGIDAGAKDMFGSALHTGDIVNLWSVEYPGTDAEVWRNAGGLTAVVFHQYKTFTNGAVELNKEPEAPFVMGIASVPWDSPDWRIERVKSFADVVEGENWPHFGFSYRRSVAAERAKAAAIQAPGAAPE